MEIKTILRPPAAREYTDHELIDKESKAFVGRSLYNTSYQGLFIIINGRIYFCTSDTFVYMNETNKYMVDRFCEKLEIREI